MWSGLPDYAFSIKVFLFLIFHFLRKGFTFSQSVIPLVRRFERDDALSHQLPRMITEFMEGISKACLPFHNLSISFFQVLIFHPLRKGFRISQNKKIPTTEYLSSGLIPIYNKKAPRRVLLVLCVFLSFSSCLPENPERTNNKHC